jgi:hypothetical protein
MNGLAITFDLDFEDYYDARRTRDRKNRRARWIAILVVVVIVWIRLGSFRVRNLGTVIFAELLLLSLLPLSNWFIKRSYRSSFRRTEKVTEKKTIQMRFDPEGLRLISTDQPGLITWNELSGFSESNRSFVFYRSRLIDAIIPKQAIASTVIDEIRSVLKSNLKQI